MPYFAVIVAELPASERDIIGLSMISTGQFVNGIWMGTVLLVLGLIPDMMQNLANAMAEFAHALQFRESFRLNPRIQIRQPRWFASIGAGMIVVTILAYFAG